MTHKTNDRATLVLAALAGILAAGTANAAEKDEVTSASNATGSNVECYGINRCKGTGACGGAGHSCAGQNACKGKGWLSMDKQTCLKIAGASLKPVQEQEAEGSKPRDQKTTSKN